jgi:hypothetical protein
MWRRVASSQQTMHSRMFEWETQAHIVEITSLPFRRNGVGRTGRLRMRRGLHRDVDGVPK